LGRTLAKWNPCGFHTPVSIVFGPLIAWHSIVAGFPWPGSWIYSCAFEKENEASSKIMIYFHPWFQTERRSDHKMQSLELFLTV
jgi:hypothetical protein